MPPDVLMPKLSDTMEEGKIIRWLKQRGDRVAIGDILAEVETDKANMELEAFDEGVLSEIRTAEGEAAPVGAVIAVLAEPGAAVRGNAAPAPEAVEKEGGRPAASTEPAPPPPSRPRTPSAPSRSSEARSCETYTPPKCPAP